MLRFLSSSNGVGIDRAPETPAERGANGSGAKFGVQGVAQCFAEEIVCEDG